jgi:ABC-type phosphate transport system substrate-binding protein
MKNWIFQFLACLMLLGPSAWAHHMAVVVDKGNKVENITALRLAKIFKGEVKKWADGQDVALVLHESSPDESKTLSRLLKMTDAQWKVHVEQHKGAIRTVKSDADVLDAVASTPGAIGLVEERAINSRVNVVKVDGKLPAETGYLPH